MSKGKYGSLSSSAGFNSQGSGFAQTLKKDSWNNKPSELANTMKETVLNGNNASRSENRKQLIQNFLEQNAMNDMDFKTTMNLGKAQSQGPQQVEKQNDPFRQSSFSKTQNLMVEDLNSVEASLNPAAARTGMSGVAIPGVLHIKTFTGGLTFQPKRQREPIVMIQAMVRGAIQRMKFKSLKREYDFMLNEHRKFTEQEQEVLRDRQVKDEIQSQLKRLPLAAKRRPSLQAKPALLENPTPVLKSDGLQIWHTMNRKITGRRLSTKSLEENDEPQVMLFNDPKPVQKTTVTKKAPPPLAKPPSVPQTKLEDSVRLNQSKSSIAEEVYLEEDFEQYESVQEELIQESGIKSIQEDSMIKESISAAKESTSMIKESISVVKESIIKDSIQEEYADDFEEASQSMQAPPKKQQAIRESQDIDEYIEEEFDSYSQKSDIKMQKKSVTFDESAQQSRQYSPEPQKLIQNPQPNTQEIKSFLEQPKLIYETQPIKYVASKWAQDDEQRTILARKEAEFILEKFRNRYKDLRNLQFDEEAFSKVEKEHFAFMRVKKDVDTLLNGTSQLNQKLKDQPKAQLTASADVILSKFQFEFHRLMSVNSLGNKLSNLIGSIGIFENKGQQQIPTMQFQKVLQSIEQQQVIVQQVLQQVMVQLNSLFVEQQALQEVRLYRQEQDQKLQQMMLKQDKLISDKLESQLMQRDEELKRFIRGLFEKQRREFGTVKLMPTQKLQDAFQRSLSNIQQPFQSFVEQSGSKLLNVKNNTSQKSLKEDSSYQPDFETLSEPSQRMKSYESVDQYQVENSMSIDREVNEYESFVDIDWQNDINLFEVRAKPDQTLKERQTQQIVDYLSQLLLNEIQDDLFPRRRAEDNKQSAPIKQQVILQPAPKPSASKEEPKKEEPKKEEPPKLATKVAAKKQDEEDDFGMGMGGPLFKRSDLEKEFDLSEDTEPESKEDVKKVELKVDPEYQKFVNTILNKYGEQLLKKRSTIIKLFLDLSEKQNLGGVMATDFKILKQKEVQEKDAFSIVQALEEQLGFQLLRIRSEYTKFTSRKQHETNLAGRFDEALKLAKQQVLKITEKLIPTEAYQQKKYDFSQAYQYARTKGVPKECPQNFEVQEHEIDKEMYQIGDDLHDKLLLNILEEVMSDFQQIGNKRRR